MHGSGLKKGSLNNLPDDTAILFIFDQSKLFNSKLQAMIIHQLSVFLENKSGRLTEVLEALGQENIKINCTECCGYIGIRNPAHDCFRS